MAARRSEAPARASPRVILVRWGGRAAAACAAGAFALSAVAFLPAAAASVRLLLAAPALLAVAAWVLGGFTMSTDAPKDPAAAALFAREKRYALAGVAAAGVWAAAAFFAFPAVL